MDAADPAAAAPQAEVYRAARQDKPWGHELIFAALDGKYAGKIIHVETGHSLSLQYHREKEETISVLAGDALVLYGPAADRLTEQRFGPGDTIHLPPGVLHRITACLLYTSFLRSALAFLRVQRPPYLAASMLTVRLPGGPDVVRVQFASPSPLGLLTGGNASADTSP